jgi:hypothetical protein
MAANLAKRTVVMSGKHLVAVCQLTCRNNINENLNICQQLIADAARANAKVFYFILFNMAFILDDIFT